MFEWLRRRSVTCSTLHYLVMQGLYRLGLRKHLSGATHRRYTLDQSVEYVRRVVRDYLDYGGLAEEDLAGKRILEVGPGDNLGVALLLVALGAERVVCLDRFASQRDEVKNRAVYRALLDTLDAPARARAAACLDPEGAITTSRIECCAAAIEDAATRLVPGSFDLIVSRAVLEHVYDVEASWRAMDQLLVPSGQMLHKIDLRCHSYYESFHPLWFLSVPTWLWRAVSSPDPTLNRARRADYERLIEQYGYDARILVTHLATRADELIPHRACIERGVDYTDAERDLVESIRPRLSAPFQSASTDDLLISGIFVSARKRLAQENPA